MTPKILTARRRNAGFTLVELLVVVLIVGILAAIAVPQYFKVVEKGRVAEATSCAGDLNGAQERYFLKNNVYTNTPAQLDTTCQMRYFSFNIPAADSTSYQLSFTRLAPVPPVYASYTFTFTAGTGAVGSYGSGSPSVAQDLLP